MKVGLIFSLLFPNLCLGKYLLVETEDDGEIVPGNKIEDANELIWADTGLDWSRPDDHDDDKEDEVSYDPSSLFEANRQSNVPDSAQIIKKKNRGLPCVFRCHG